MRWDARAGAFRLLGLALPVVFLTIAGRTADARAGALLVARLGPLLPCALLPYALSLACDTQGWRTLLSAGTRRRARWRHLFAARLAGETVAQTLPWAGFGGELVSAWFLRRTSATPLPPTLGGLVVRRLLLAPGHGLVLLLAALAALSQPGLPRILAAASALAALALWLTVVAGLRLLARGSPFGRLQSGLRRWSWLGLGPSVALFRLGDADREARLLLSGKARPLVAASFFLLVFFAECGETLLLLRLLGVPVSALQVLAVEPLVSLARTLAVFAPAGLGVQELGYLSLLRLAGIPNVAAVGSAFVLLKRAKELAWTGAGWSLVLASGLRPHAAAPAEKTRRPAEEVPREPRAPANPVHLRFAESDDTDAPDRARAFGA